MSRTMNMTEDMPSLFLFDDQGNASVSPESVQPSAPHAASAVRRAAPQPPARKVKAKAARPVKPALLEDIEKAQKAGMQPGDLLSRMGFAGVDIKIGYCHPCTVSCAVKGTALRQLSAPASGNELHLTQSGRDHEATVLHCTPEGEAWYADVTVHGIEISSYPAATASGNMTMKIGAWKPADRLLPGVSCMQTQQELETILKSTNRYGFMYMQSRPKLAFRPEVLITCPHIEILDKAGYAFVETVVRIRERGDTNAQRFNLLCRRGTRPKDIFKASKTLCSVLKNEKDLSIWDAFRKMEKLGKISEDHIGTAYRHGLKRDQLEKVSVILGMKYSGRQVISFDKLMDYLAKVDMHEAIGTDEALMLIKDYVRMCIDMDIEPRFDRDSLKREHDVMARNSRQLLNASLQADMDARMAPHVAAMKRFDYREGVYFIRGIRSYDDLVAEAKGQSNCVASYAGPIAAGETYIYVMRELAEPTKSLITVELSPDGRKIRQMSKAHNAPIRNKSQSEFLERWLKHNRETA